MRPLKSYTLTLVLAAFSATARAADAPKAEGLMAMMQKGMAGHAVIAVGTGGYEIRDKAYDEAAFAAAKDELGRLQVISRAASTDDMPLIPFGVRKAWVIGPQFRQDLRTSFSGVAPLAAMPYDALIDRAVLALSPEQMEKAGDGIPFSELPKEAQQALMLAVRPPFKVSTPRNGPVTLPDGRQIQGWQWTDNGRVTEPVDWSRVRFRARLRLEMAFVQRPGSKVGVSLGQHSRTGEPTMIPDRRTWGSSIPIYDTKPNTFRPSDLATDALEKPIGVSGVLYLADVVAQLAKVTGLPLSVAPAFRYAPVFLGRDDLACGDVADGLRLALTGTWRRVGDGYVLAWDTPGWAADRLRVEEATAGLSRAVETMTNAQRDGAAWLAVAEHLPFDPDDPLSPTDDQRRALFGLDLKPDTTDKDRPPAFPGDEKMQIAFDEMTPRQQKFLQDAAQTEEMTLYDDSMHEVGREPMTAADVQSARLSGGSTTVRVSLDLPGFGWVETRQMPLANSLNAYQLWNIRAKDAMKAWRKGQAERHRDDPLDIQPKPAALPAKSRGLMVPALGPSAVTALINRMKAHGLDTLLYPALDAGYATFPSEVFPLAPSLRGKSGWEAASAAAKANGIRLAAWLSPVAWQNAGQKVHWLDKRRDLLDVDALGRTPIEWREQNPPAPPAEDSPFEDLPPAVPPLAWNYARPAEPEVARRLDRFVSEVSRLPAVAALAIVDWAPPNVQRQRPDEALPPPLGFALPDRIAALKSTGNDPADDVSSSTYANSAWQFPDVLNLLGWMEPPKDAPDRAPRRPLEETRFHDLAARVLARAKADRKDWQTWRVDARTPELHIIAPQSEPLPPAKPPAADLALGTAAWDRGAAGSQKSFILVVPPRSAVENLDAPAAAKKLLPAAIIAMTMGTPSPGTLPFDVALYDFRQCPEDIMESLRWIAAPKGAGSTATGQRNGGEAGRGAGHGAGQ